MATRLADFTAPVTALAPQTLAAAAETLVIDRLGWDSAAFYTYVGAVNALSNVATFTQTCKVADELSGPYTDADPLDLSTPMAVLNNANQANKISMVEYLGTHRFLKVTLEPTGSPSAFVNIWAMLSGPQAVLNGRPQQGL